MLDELDSCLVRGGCFGGRTMASAYGLRTWSACHGIGISMWAQQKIVLCHLQDGVVSSCHEEGCSETWGSCRYPSRLSISSSTTKQAQPLPYARWVTFRCWCCRLVSAAPFLPDCAMVGRVKGKRSGTPTCHTSRAREPELALLISPDFYQHHRQNHHNHAHCHHIAILPGTCVSSVDDVLSFVLK
jgi:hypothetical protein